jgi:enoyl-CoA hydratase/carnithine racemase
MSFTRIAVEHRDRIFTITLNRLEVHNVLNEQVKK